MTYEEKLNIVDQYIRGINESDIDLIRPLFADDAVVEDPVGTTPHVGKVAIMSFYEAFLDFDAEIERTGMPRCPANLAVFPFWVKANGMKIEVIDQFEFDENKKIISMKAFWCPENTSMG